MQTGSATGTFGVIFTLSQPAALTGIWVYSSNADSALPAEIGIWDTAAGTLVPGTDNSSPSWSGALGSGWVKCSYDGTVTLDARSRGYIVTRLVLGNHGYTQSYTYPLTSGCHSPRRGRDVRAIQRPVQSEWRVQHAQWQQRGRIQL